MTRAGLDDFEQRRKDAARAANLVTHCDVPNHPNNHAHDCDGRDPYERCSPQKPCESANPLHIALFGECFHTKGERT